MREVRSTAVFPPGAQTADSAGPEYRPPAKYAGAAAEMLPGPECPEFAEYGGVSGHPEAGAGGRRPVGPGERKAPGEKTASPPPGRPQIGPRAVLVKLLGRFPARGASRGRSPSLADPAGIPAAPLIASFPLQKPVRCVLYPNSPQFPAIAENGSGKPRFQPRNPAFFAGITP